jgi:hypothetical protein
MTLGERQADRLEMPRRGFLSAPERDTIAALILGRYRTIA